jgi:hypothetical protein
MITAEYILEFFEERLPSINVGGKNVIIYSNPNKTNIEKLNSRKVTEVGFIVRNRPQSVFVWDSTLAMVSDVSKPLVGIGDPERSNVIVIGVAKVSDSGLIIRDKSDINFGQTIKNWIKKSELFSIKWNWVDKYLSNFSSSLSEYQTAVENELKKQKDLKSEKK